MKFSAVAPRIYQTLINFKMTTMKHSSIRPTLLCKACQSGKTSEALYDWVTAQMRQTQGTIKARRIAFFICDNSLLLTKQTTVRATDDLLALNGDVVTISCKASIKRVSQLYNTITTNKVVNTIVCCGNNRRLQDLSELLDLIYKLYDVYEFYIYVDEADKVLHSKKAREQAEIWRHHPLVEKLTLITATPQENISKGLSTDFGKLELHKMRSILADTYQGLRDCIHIDTPTISKITNVEYAEEVLTHMAKPKIGEVWFIPGEHKVITHDEMQTMLFKKGFNCVMKINGQKKEITYLKGIKQNADELEYDVETKTFKDIHEECVLAGNEEFSPYNNEISRWLGHYYSKNDGQNKWKFAITGNVCISRGISLQSPECYITHAIFGPACSRSNAGKYQIYARVCGNVEKFPGYIKHGPSKVITHRRAFKKICKMENLAVNLATISVGSQLGHKPVVIENPEQLEELEIDLEA